MEDTWKGKKGSKGASEKFIGYIAPLTEGNAEYVAILQISEWRDQGQSEERIALNWNGGPGAKKCSKGVSKGVKYNSCNYVAVYKSL